MTSHDGPSDVPEISPLELKQRLDNQHPLVLLDVREPHEWDVADLPDYHRRRIPIRELMARVAELDPAEPLVVYCRSGRRSGVAVARLRTAGFDNVWNLAGGLLGWREDVDSSLPYY